MRNHKNGNAEHNFPETEAKCIKIIATVQLIAQIVGQDPKCYGCSRHAQEDIIKAIISSTPKRLLSFLNEALADAV
jgi:hypothetical protein